MKKLMMVYLLLIVAFVGYVVMYRIEDQRRSTGWQDGGLHGSIGENYVMVTFQSGMEYWKNILKGFEDGGDALGVSVDYRGSTQYDAKEQITVLEQVIAKKPAGIALSAIDSRALTSTINKAVDAGIPVVLFDADAPSSKAYSFLATNNYEAGETAADEMARILGREGQVGIITQPGQQNHDDRMAGFRDAIAAKYPAMSVVDVKEGKGDTMIAKNAAAEMIKKHPELKGIFATEASGGAGAADAVIAANKTGKVKIIGFDTNKATLDRISDGTISATIAQGTWNMGYWSLQYLFHLHHGLTVPAPTLGNDVSPLPPRVDTGVTVVTRENVNDYYAK
ncbi:substrate-binding domain-containing protein [Paenibacillus sp. FSL M7-1455]|uniref:substrate-binding domain-containing protein n=1 Tax=Paenibacillus sp. FSL M7-1455 TaxID=2975316 RepID=UPI00054325A0|nr:D-allose-binding periplasmic protein precursor [Paenibacillus sp. P1XP2]